MQRGGLLRDFPLINNGVRFKRIRKQNFPKSLSLMQGLKCEVTNVLCSFELIIFTAIALSVHNFQLQ
ncbi:hypothetical protein TNIN_21031 [Trichonephila inaurata madagascariensis]|uniref:Uncharacterized protein n=1 Tax=Trichonephila inaurata madagascariensis TaxID=2747483 RepID=A0A8X6Y141_9ARAC|nr:hypothetical protein TNIN_21031 [Trichonephila inaurata madagascariensis]